MKNMFVAAILVLLLLGACAQKVEKIDIAAEKAAVKNALDQVQQAMVSENLDKFSTLVAHDNDMVSFGTDASERWVGWDALKTAMEQQNAAFDSMNMTIRDQVIKVSPAGDAAWFSELIDWSIETGGQKVNLNGARATGVLEKRAGKWLLVQMHFSVGVAGQAAEY